MLRRCFKKLRIGLSYDTVNHNTRDLSSSVEVDVLKVIYNSMFIATFIPIAKVWNQSKCPLTDEWIKKIWCAYTMEYYIALKGIESCHSQHCGWA
jgi:hypothetical protein